MTYSDSASSGSEQAGESSLMGDGLTVLSAGLYAGYTVIMRKRMPGEEAEAHVGAFFGYVGLYTTVSVRVLSIYK